VDGLTLTRALRELLQEPVSSSFLDDRATYEYLYKAAVEVASRTRLLTSTWSFTTTADTAAYLLPADFLDIYPVDDYNRPFIKYGSTNFIYNRDYSAVLMANSSSSVPVPATYSVIDAPASASITGTATSAGPLDKGEAILTDASGPFLNVSVGDTVHNMTDGSSGYVVSVTSASQIVTCLFDGTTRAWSSGDSYVVSPQARYQLVFDPPPANSGDEVTVVYVQKPSPVFSPYRSYRLPPTLKEAVVYYAGWLYKNRGQEPNYADYLLQHFEMELMRQGINANRALQKRPTMRVNMIKIANTSGSYRW